MPAVAFTITKPQTITVGTAGAVLTFTDASGNPYPLDSNAGVTFLGDAANTASVGVGDSGVVATPTNGVLIPPANTDRTNIVRIPTGTIAKLPSQQLYIGSSLAAQKVEIVPWFA